MNIKIENFQNICRTCLQHHSPRKKVYDLEFYSPKNNINVVDFIYNLTHIKFEKGDGLPEHLCTICIKKVNEAYEFSLLCHNSHTKLQQSLKECYEDNDAISKQTKSSNVVQLENENENSSLEHPIEIIHFNSNNYNDYEIIHENSSDNGCANNKINFDNINHEILETEKLNKYAKPKIYKCELCDKSFVRKVHLTIHLKSHSKTNEKQYICEECGKSYSYLYLLRQHRFKHTEVKPFPCTKCNKGCMTRESLRRHMKIHDANYKRKKYVCEICRKDFPYPSFLAEHMKNHTGERPFLCSICGKGFRQSGALRYHMRSHTGSKPYECKVCHNRFISKGTLRVHMRKHTNERPYVCDLCGMAFRQSTDMKSHRRIHTGDKRVLCTVCGKRMSTTGQLTIHLRTHTGEKPYSCNTCSKAFTTRTMLVKHERIHTGERPYVCNICGRAFNQSSTLKTHINVHNGQKSKTGQKQVHLKGSVVNNGLRLNINDALLRSNIMQATVNKIESEGGSEIYT